MLGTQQRVTTTVGVSRGIHVSGNRQRKVHYTRTPNFFFADPLPQPRRRRVTKEQSGQRTGGLAVNTGPSLLSGMVNSIDGDPPMDARPSGMPCSVCFVVCTPQSQSSSILRSEAKPHWLLSFSPHAHTRPSRGHTAHDTVTRILLILDFFGNNSSGGDVDFMLFYVFMRHFSNLASFHPVFGDGCIPPLNPSFLIPRYCNFWHLCPMFTNLETVVFSALNCILCMFMCFCLKTHWLRNIVLFRVFLAICRIWPEYPDFIRSFFFNFHEQTQWIPNALVLNNRVLFVYFFGAFFGPFLEGK